MPPPARAAPLYTYARARARARTGRRRVGDARRASRQRAVDLQRDARRLSHHDRRRSLRLQHLDAGGDPADRLCRRQERGDVQPRRPQRGVHQEQQYFRREQRRAPVSDALTSDGSAAAAERHARLGLFRRAVRPWQPPRVLVEPGFVAHRVPAVRREGGPGYTLVDDIPYHPAIERWNYPKAGDPNPIGAAWRRLDQPTGSVRWIDTAKYHRLPHRQRRLDAGQPRRRVSDSGPRADVARPQPRRRRRQARRDTILRETSKAWVERWQDASVDPIWLKDGSFLWLSERSGWRHFYHYAADGTLIRQVTQGEWEIRRTHGVDPSGTWVYFTSTAHSPIGLDLYRVRLDGTDMQRLSTTAGRHQVFVNPSRTLFLDSWSDITTPPQVRLHATTRAMLVRVVDANTVSALEGARAVDAGADAGEDARRVRHGSHDDQAAGLRPCAPLSGLPVHVRGTASRSRSSTLGVARIFCITSCSPSAASSCGSATTAPRAARACSRRGRSTRTSARSSCRTSKTALEWLKRQPYVDGSRIGIAGVSFGAYMTLYALTHSRSFAMGIAEGAVSDWRNYDTIYTERYMGLPDDNPDGYRRSSPRFSAANLSGRAAARAQHARRQRASADTPCSLRMSCSRRASRSG